MLPGAHLHRHTEDTFRIKLAGLLEGLAKDGHGRVHRVGNDADKRLRASTENGPKETPLTHHGLSDILRELTKKSANL